MPLEAVMDHIDFIIQQLKSWDGRSVPYPRARKNLEISVSNYQRGLQIIENCLAKVVISRAKDIAETVLKRDGKIVDVDDIIVKRWHHQIADCYRIVERFYSSISLQIHPVAPLEIYYWIRSLFDNFELKIPFVLEASSQFTNHTFRESILDPLKPLVEIGDEYLPGTLEKSNASDILDGHPISEGYTISYIRGEGRNILLWPILVHECFHVIDREKHLLANMNEYLKQKNNPLPILSENEKTNLNWISEIFTDVISMKYFGPLYGLSLLNYFERLPYIQTIEHPEMSVRLKAVHQYLSQLSQSFPYTDILQKCRESYRDKIQRKIQIFKDAGDLPEEKEKKVVRICESVSSWLDGLRITSFNTQLRDYVLRKSQMNKKIFLDPVFRFDEIADLLFEDEISLAINPNILLNVVLANHNRYNPDRHFDIIKDSILKWKIKQTWNEAVEKHKDIT